MHESSANAHNLQIQHLPELPEWLRRKTAAERTSHDGGGIRTCGHRRQKEAERS